jgi:hypothetical protein
MANRLSDFGEDVRRTFDSWYLYSLSYAMKKEEAEEIKNVIRVYKEKKAALISKREAIEQLMKQGRIPAWSCEEQIDQLYREFVETPEARNFQQLSKRASDPREEEFEKYFRETFLNVYQEKNYFTEEEYADMARAINEDELYAVGAKMADKAFDYLQFSLEERSHWRQDIINAIAESKLGILKGADIEMLKQLLNATLLSTIQSCDYQEKQQKGIPPEE